MTTVVRQLAKQRRRRGSAYFMVLGASMLVLVIGLSALTVSRINLRATGEANDWLEAGALAFSGVELGLATVGTTPAWRSTYTHRVPSSELDLGGGTVSWFLEDQADSDLSNDDSNPVRVFGIGRVGEAARVYSVLLQPSGEALTCLEVALHAGNDLQFSNTDLQCRDRISANNSVIAAGSTIEPNVEAVNTITGGTYNGSAITTGIAPRTMPSANVLDYYLTNGTTIDYSDLPTTGGAAAIENVVLSPGNNPFGAATNAEGIFVVDCRGNDIIIRDCRILGTLVLLNSPPSSTIENSIHWEPAVANFPALLVSGGITLMTTTAPLSETTTSFNPPGTGHHGAEDTDTNDTYPSQIVGLIYVSGDLTVYNQPVVDGVIVVGNTLVSLDPGGGPVTLDLQYDQAFLDSPPPGFSAGDQMAPVHASWRWETMP